MNYIFLMEIVIRPSLKPHFDPAVWNNTSRLGVTNCYTYALDAQNCSWLDLGMLGYGGIATGEVDQKRWGSEEGLRELALRDGLIPVPLEEIDPATRHTLAIMGAKISLGKIEDDDGSLICESSLYYFHCLRIHREGMVSEKNGAGHAIDVTYEGTPLTIDNYRQNYADRVSRVAQLLFNDAAQRGEILSLLTSLQKEPEIIVVSAGFFKIPEQGLTLHLDI